MAGAANRNISLWCIIIRTMNFLAHALLAGAEPALVVGGVAGDWIKGPLQGSLALDLVDGVALHRAIDSHAEMDPGFTTSRRRISAGRRRYSGVLVDIFFDHLLAREWATVHTIPLEQFSARVYEMIFARLPELPADALFALELMASEDWLTNYARFDFMAEVLSRMSRRARQHHPLAGAEVEFLRDPTGFAADFRLWLVAASEFSRRWRLARTMDR